MSDCLGRACCLLVLREPGKEGVAGRVLAEHAGIPESKECSIQVWAELRGPIRMWNTPETSNPQLSASLQGLEGQLRYWTPEKTSGLRLHWENMEQTPSQGPWNSRQK